jgi:hypothetical protein
MQILPSGMKAISAFCPAGNFFLLAGMQNSPVGRD